MYGHCPDKCPLSGWHRYVPHTHVPRLPARKNKINLGHIAMPLGYAIYAVFGSFGAVVVAIAYVVVAIAEAYEVTV